MLHQVYRSPSTVMSFSENSKFKDSRNPFIFKKFLNLCEPCIVPEMVT